MRIILIEPPISRPKDETVGIAAEVPMALVSLAATLLKRNHEVHIIDAFAEGYFERTIRDKNSMYIGLTFEDILQRILNFRADIVGISSIFFFNAPVVVELANFLKERCPNLQIILGGIVPGVLYQKIMKEKGVDFIVRGEGDHILPDLAENIKNPAKVHGIIWRKGAKIIINEDVPLPEDLDQLPFPARELSDLDLYIKLDKPFGFVKERKRFTTILTSRGCPFSCAFCSAHLVHGKKIRYRSPENVLMEIDELVQNYGINEVHIIDENFSLDKSRAMKIMNGLIMRGYNKFLSWTCPNGLFVKSLDEEVIDKMQESNCISVALAVESGNHDVCKNMVRKPVDHKQVERVVRYFKEHTDILLCGYFIIGFPGETKKQVIETFNFANKLQMHNATISILMPYPFTDIYNIALRDGYLILDETDEYFSNLMPKHGVIKTNEFDPSWLKAIQETDRFLALLKKKKKTFWRLCWELIFRVHWMLPRVAVMIIYHAIKGDISGKK
ncbi:MAG: radical SAM protein [Candidatus Omnitrophota bacterium]